ncbi:MAG: hypothetical protein H7293_21815 [Candidatus Saccharibacteria bacterium]|nr:hypothetical protein [Rhodoferax sp.]
MHRAAANSLPTKPPFALINALGCSADRATHHRKRRVWCGSAGALERLRKAGRELIDFGALAPNSPLRAAVTAMAQAAPMTPPVRVPTAAACAVPEASQEVRAPPGHTLSPAHEPLQPTRRSA